MYDNIDIYCLVLGHLAYSWSVAKERDVASHSFRMVSICLLDRGEMRAGNGAGLLLHDDIKTMGGIMNKQRVPGRKTQGRLELGCHRHLLHAQCQMPKGSQQFRSILSCLRNICPDTSLKCCSGMWHKPSSKPKSIMILGQSCWVCMDIIGCVAQDSLRIEHRRVCVAFFVVMHRPDIRNNHRPGIIVLVLIFWVMGEAVRCCWPPTSGEMIWVIL